MSSIERAPVQLAPTTPVGHVVDDRARYAEVFQRHHVAMVRLAVLLSGDQHRAEEAVAEAFAKVWPPFRAGRVLDEGAYLRRAVVNEVHALGRRRGRDRRLVERQAAAPDRPDPTIGDHVAERDALIAALATLPLRQRAVIVLRYYEDLSEAATAAALDMRLGTVKSQSARGLARLRAVLSPQEDR